MTDDNDMRVEWSNKPNSDEHAKKLERQIAHDQAQPVKPSEKRVKLDTSFEDAVRQLSRKPPKGE